MLIMNAGVILMDQIENINTAKVQKYIENTLGVTVNFHRWKGEFNLPFYLTERYEMRLAEMDVLKCIFLWPKEKLNQIVSIRKQLRRIQMEEDLPVVFVMDSMDTYRRTAFVKVHIPFIVPEYQLYLPFAGTYLQEKYAAEIRNSEPLQPSAQLLLFYWYYQHENCLYMNDAVKALRCSAMTVTRAFRQLENTGYFETGKSGVQKYLKATADADEILCGLEDRLLSPVADTIYADRQETEKKSVLSALMTAGNSALTQMGFGAEEDIPCYAVEKKGSLMLGSHELINAETQAEIQLWKYDPSILSRNGNVDPLSLALSLHKPLDSFIKRIDIHSFLW